VLDVNAVNAFVTSMVPRAVFVFKGIFNVETLGGVLSNPMEAGSRVLALMGSEWRRAEVVAINDMKNCQDGYLLHFDGLQDDQCVPKAQAMLRARREVAVVENDEQLALLLSHELSHVIHGHLEDRMRFLALLAGFQLLVISILDPVGLASFAVEMCVPAITKFGLQLPYSRDAELEADATGLRICARAGFNPETARELVARLKATAAPGEDFVSWLSTHPSYDYRTEQLRANTDAAMELYKAKKLRR